MYSQIFKCVKIPVQAYNIYAVFPPFKVKTQEFYCDAPAVVVNVSAGFTQIQ